MQENQNEKTTGKKRRGLVLGVIAAVLAALVFFGAGYATFYLSMDKSLSSLWWLKRHIDEYYMEEFSDEDFLVAATDGINYSLDKYSRFYTAEEYSVDSASREGNQAGLGLSIIEREEGLFVYFVAGNSPAYRANVSAGEFIFAYGTAENNLIEATSRNAFLEFLRERKTNEPFFVRVGKEGETAKITSLAKENYEENYVFYASSSSRYSMREGVWGREEGNLSALNEDTAYLRLTEFYGDAALQMEEALKIFQREGKKNLVLDLRGNGGGDLRVLTNICRFFLKNNTKKNPLIALARDKNGAETSFRAKNALPFETYFSSESKIFVLADQNTASASEAFIGALVDYGTITFSDIYLTEEDGVAKTYGKGIMQTIFSNQKTGEGVRLTSAKVYWPVSERCIHGVGVTSENGAKSVPGSWQAAFTEESLLSFLAAVQE